MARYRPVLLGDAVAEVENDFIDIAPAPALGRIVAFDDRVAGAGKVVALLGRVDVDDTGDGFTVRVGQVAEGHSLGAGTPDGHRAPAAP